jgi:hypothetical protein
VWLIVTSQTSVKRVELGVLAGLWAALIGAFSMFGAPRFVHPLDAGSDQPPGTGLELRAGNLEVERAEEAAARRAHEVRLEQMLRREIQATMTREVAALRAEIASLRSELLEKVGGQLRLERIETTRVIGSDLEALQHEVRQLKAVSKDTGDVGSALGRLRPSDTGTMRPVVEPARVRPVSRQTAEVEADVQPARPGHEPAAAYEPRPPAPPAETTGPIGSPVQPRAAAPQPATPPPSAPQPAAAPAPAPAPAPAAPTAAATPPSPAPAPAPAPQAGRPTPPSPAPAADDFAALPRLRPFTDFELEPVEPSYTGRRRRADDEPANGDGRHSASNGEEPPRRHRRAEDSDDDLLARLLARETSP